jgi:hypothetical protein
MHAQGPELCLAIVGPLRVRNHLSEGMWMSVLCHTKMVRELATLRVAVSSAVELALGRSPDETSRVEVVGELVAKFWRLEERCSRLEWPSVRVCHLLLGPPPSQA